MKTGSRRLAARLLGACTLLLVPLAAAAGERPVVIELFTSQGCSSCPPAEALLGNLAGRPNILPLSFHVTYWNKLGWTDAFSFEGATHRQEAYAAQLGSGSPFTPQAVIDGRTSVIGSRRGDVEAALARAASRSGGADVALTREGDSVRVRVGAGDGAARILLVGFDRERTTPIGRGENRGRTIRQSNVVRSLRAIGSWSGKAVALTEAAPAGEDVAVILQAADGSIVGAARLRS